MSGTHEFVGDERNRNILIYVNGEFFPRHEAKVSVFERIFRCTMRTVRMRHL